MGRYFVRSSSLVYGVDLRATDDLAKALDSFGAEAACCARVGGGSVVLYDERRSVLLAIDLPFADSPRA